MQGHIGTRIGGKGNELRSQAGRYCHCRRRRREFPGRHPRVAPRPAEPDVAALADLPLGILMFSHRPAP